MMENVARGWLVLELTNSPLALGVVAFASGLPRLFLALMAGVLADRFDRRRLLVLCGVGDMLTSFVFATLVLAGRIELWHILVLVLSSSVFSTLNQVARNALIPDIVPRMSLPNAIALFSTVRATVQIVAQSVAGVLIAVIGVAGVLYVNAASFLAILIALLLMQIPAAPVSIERLGFREDLGRGLAYVWAKQELWALMLLGLVPIVLIQPYRTLMPVIARDVLHVGAAGYGMLMAAPGLGGVVAAVGLAALNPSRRGRLMLGSLFVLSVALVTVGVAQSFLLALGALTLVGLAFNVYRITNNTALQLQTPRAMMGRVMGIYQTDRGLQPVGSLLLGWVASLAGAPVALICAAVGCALFTAAVLAARPSLRNL